MFNAHTFYLFHLCFTLFTWLFGVLFAWFWTVTKCFWFYDIKMDLNHEVNLAYRYRVLNIQYGKEVMKFMEKFPFKKPDNLHPLNQQEYEVRKTLKHYNHVQVQEDFYWKLSLMYCNSNCILFAGRAWFNNNKDHNYKCQKNKKNETL